MMVRRGMVCATGIRQFLAVAIGALLAAALIQATAAAPARATLVYTKGWWSTDVLSLWASHNDGSSPRVLVKSTSRWLATSGRISPNGRLVAYNSLTVTGNEPSRVIVMPAGGGRQKVLARDAELLAWSPDSRRIAALIRSTHRTQLVTIDVASAKKWIVAIDWQFTGVSFSPDGKYVAYAAGPERSDLIYKNTSDIYTAPVDGGPAKRLTRDHHSDQPLWGAQWIVFSRWRELTVGGQPARREELYRVSPGGGDVRQLTHSGAWSIVAVGWSADGRRLVAGMMTQGPSRAVAVNLSTGQLRRVGPDLFSATALSRDGTTILGILMKGEGYRNIEVVEVPYAGGSAHVLVTEANDPSWDR